MASVTGICNLALSHLGHRANILSLDPPDSTVEAGLCAQFYPIARTAALEAHSWTFACKRASLVATANDSVVWAYAYVKPSDCIRPLRVLPLNAVSVFDQQDDNNTFVLTPNEANSAPFEVEGAVIRSNEPDAVLFYLRDATDTGSFTPLFALGLSQLLASMLAGPIIKGRPGKDAAKGWYETAMFTLAKAATTDARSGSRPDSYIPAHLRARA